MTIKDKKQIYWCDSCKVPVIKQDDKLFHKCPNCNSWTRYLSKDIRPVFPEERLLIEIITGQNPHTYIENSVWCNGAMYYIDGLKYKLDNDVWQNINSEDVRCLLDEYSKTNTYRYFNKFIESFVNANKIYLNSIRYETTSFIRSLIKSHPDIPKYISFSGGKDSTVCADLVIKSLGQPSILHVFCNTTLEYPYTLKYIERLKLKNNKLVLKTIQNKEHDFYKVCDDIGVPAISKRWCCTIFKTGVTSKFFTNFFSGQNVLSFSGLRSSESNMRKKYKRIENESKKRKIQNQIIVSPILYWSDIDVWLYIMSEKLDFNEAYRLGFNRVGCWCCPNTSPRGDMLARIYMPEYTKKWYTYLINYAKRIGKEKPENYIYSGNWKLIRGGQGLESSNDININKELCTSDENAMTYQLNKSVSDDFYNLFVLFGKVSKELGRKVINEVLVLRNNIPIISIQKRPNNAVKIKTLNVKDHKALHMRIAYQVLKYNACRRCYKCEGVCKSSAITIRNHKYVIDQDKCTHCLSCVSTKYISDGCIMKQYLKSRRPNNDSQ